MAFETEKQARSIGEARKTEEHLKQNSKGTVSLEDIFAKIKEGTKEINVIVKKHYNVLNLIKYIFKKWIYELIS